MTRIHIEDLGGKVSVRMEGDLIKLMEMLTQAIAKILLDITQTEEGLREIAGLWGKELLRVAEYQKRQGTVTFDLAELRRQLEEEQ